MLTHDLVYIVLYVCKPWESRSAEDAVLCRGLGCS